MNTISFSSVGIPIFLALKYCSTCVWYIVTNCDTPESANVNLRMYCIGSLYTKAINEHLLHLKICPQASGTAVLHWKQMCLIDNELTDCGGKWFSNDSSSRRCNRFRWGLYCGSSRCCQIECSLGPLSYSVILNDVNSIFWDRICQTSPQREFNYSGIVICCYFPFI